MKTIGYGLIFISIPFLMLIYMGDRLILSPQLQSPYDMFGWILLFFALLITPVTAILGRIGFAPTITDVMAWVGYIFMGFLSLVLAFCIVRDLVWVSSAGVHKLFSFGLRLFSSESINQSAGQTSDIMILNITNIGIYAFAGILTFYGVLKSRQTPSVKQVAISFKDLPPDLEELNIVQITDFHISSTLKGKWVRGVVDSVNRLSPDIVFFTGDLADGSVKRLRQDVAPLSDLASRYGCYFVTGNHEYYSGVQKWLKEIENLGFTVLMNEHTLITHGSGKLVVGGVPDYSVGYFNGNQSNPEKAIANAPDAHLKILLAHQPKSIFKAAKAGFDLVITGHTHGGQYFLWPYFVRLDQPYVSGLHTHENTQIYVSRGTGYWGPPLRIGVPPEITLIKLKNGSVNTS